MRLLLLSFLLLLDPATLRAQAPTLSFHLRALLNAGLVSSQREGRSLIYAAEFAYLRDVVGFLTRNCCARPARRVRS